MNWVTITEYSAHKNLSISTIRRYIKQNKIESKFSDGKYYIWSDTNSNDVKIIAPSFYENEISTLKLKLKQLEEENNEYKMLVKLYESEKRIEELPQLPM